MSEGNGREIVQVHAIVKGEVQGVAFRHTTRSHALRLGLVGTVRNMSSGEVEIYAQGTRSRVEHLLQEVTGPSGPGRVENVDQEFGPAITPFEGFQIIF